MKFVHYINSPLLWKDSTNTAFAILAGIETLFAVSAISLEKFWGDYSWIIKLLFVIVIFLIIDVVIFIIKHSLAKDGISLNIRGIKVNIRKGDIFKANGWKVIAFNEYFDTQVDDIIIAHNTLNGKFIDNYVADINELNKIISSENDDNTSFKRRTRNNRSIFPLGRIIRYKDYMLLAFTHFDNNQAHLTQKDYENCLRVMWAEISRTYANKPIFIPLLGSGITRFGGTPHKSNFDLLRCMLCTLRTSGVNINQTITILLTEEAMQSINIYEIKGVK